MQLFEKQLNAIYYLNNPTINELIYGGAAGGGKSALLALRLIENCQKHKGSRWLLGRSKLKTLKETTLATFFEISSKFDLQNQYKYNEQSSKIIWRNGSEILLKDLFLYPSDPEFDSLGSLEVTGGAIDEVSQISYKAWQISKSRIRYKLDHFNVTPKLIGTCNPWKGWGYKEFYKPAKDGTLKSGRAFIQALPTDNEHLPKSYLESLLTLDENSRQRLYYGNWEYDDDPLKLIYNYDSIIDIFTNKNKTDNNNRYITCDAARFGSDKAIILVWCGFSVIDCCVYDISKTTDISNKINQYKQHYQIPNSRIIVDADGVGGGVVDEVGCVGFTNNATPIELDGKKENYSNLQTQCGFMLAKAVNDALLGFECNLKNEWKDEIAEELEQLKRVEDNDGKKKLLSKDEIKKMIGRSPDWRDALLMRFYFELKKPKSPPILYS
jgi:phage terminase large subunit